MKLTPHQKAAAKPMPPFIRQLRDAVRQDRKHQTRRVIEDFSRYGCLTGDCPHEKQTECDAAMALLCPKGKVGDIRYLREPLVNVNGWAFYADDNQPVATATGAMPWRKQSGERLKVNKLSQLYMPRTAARTFTRYTDIRAHHIQDISEEDALAEGVQPYEPHVTGMLNNRTPELPTEAFQKLWDSINAARGYPWTNNDYVWALTFKLIP